MSLNHPPINSVDDLMYDQIYDQVEEVEEEPSLKVVTFESANPDFFYLTTASQNLAAVLVSHVGLKRRNAQVQWRNRL